jgi:hypothetical protein
MEVSYRRIPVEPFREPPGAEATARRLRSEANPSVDAEQSGT